MANLPFPSLPLRDVNRRTLDRAFNFEPRCNVLNTWYSGDYWQGYDDADFAWETAFGVGADPVANAGHLAGIMAPFDCRITRIQAFAYPNSGTQTTEIAWYKFPLTAGATAPGSGTLVHTATLGPSTASEFVDLSVDLDVTLDKDELLVVFARETVTAVATSVYCGVVYLEES